MNHHSGSTVGQDVIRPIPTLATTIPLLVTALAVTQGLQLLLGALSSLSVYLGQVRDIDPIMLAVLIFLLFLAGFAAPLIRHLVGWRRGVCVLAGALAILRLAEQLAATPDVRLAVEIAGVAIWLCLLPILAVPFGASSRDSKSGRAGIGILLGLTIATAVNGAFKSLDPSFSSELAPLLVTFALTCLQLVLVLWLIRSPEVGESPGGPSISTWCIGPVLALEVLLFQNLARHTVLMDWSLPAVFAWLSTANLLALGVATLWSRHRAKQSRWTLLIAVAALLGCVVPIEHPAWSVFTAWAGPIAVAVLLVEALSFGTSGWRGWLSAGLGLLAVPLVLFGWYAHYELPLPVPQWSIPLFAAGLVALAPHLRQPPAGADLGSGHPGAALPARLRDSPIELVAIGLAALLLLLPLYVQFTWNTPKPRLHEETPLRVATYNIHQGFDLRGQPSLEEIAEQLEAKQPQIIALQEVPRGWVVNGSFDALSWLAQRLDMFVAWGPAADPLWGNAILSRYPIIDVDNRPMPNNAHLRFDRAYLLVTVEVGSERIQVVATHLHHIEREPQHRLPQVRALLEGIDWSVPTVLLGDLNAQPHHRELRLLFDSGLSGGDAPVPTYPSNRPRRQLDYILVTSHFVLENVEAIETTASDHRPLIGRLSTRDETR
jgi:endonuclease/exonuclease/phosphatase family metal-dependent hydrolase